MSKSNSPRGLSGKSHPAATAQLRSPQARSCGFLPATSHGYETPQHQAELFYLQKQIQAQVPMVIVLEDGEQVEGTIEWYDRHTIKIRGRVRTLVYKSAIKYMYKLGDSGR